MLMVLASHMALLELGNTSGHLSPGYIHQQVTSLVVTTFVRPDIKFGLDRFEACKMLLSVEFVDGLTVQLWEKSTPLLIFHPT